PGWGERVHLAAAAGAVTANPTLKPPEQPCPRQAVKCPSAHSRPSTLGRQLRENQGAELVCAGESELVDGREDLPVAVGELGCQLEQLLPADPHGDGRGGRGSADDVIPGV